MAVEILLFAGTIDGDLPLDPLHAPYIGGQPAKITATGVNLAIDTDAAAVIGILKNDSRFDDVSGPQVADQLVSTMTGVSVIFGANKIRLAPSSDITGALVSPFIWPGTAHAWVEGDEIFVGALGKWDNAGGVGATAKGRVVKAPASATDDMHVYQYPS